MSNDGSNSQYRTRGALLSRVRDISDVEAWNEFVADYGPLILRWCDRHGLQEADSADVVQDVLASLVTAMRNFDYNPGRGRFRGWLKTVTHHKVIDFVRSRKRPGEGSGDAATVRILDACESPDTVEVRLRSLAQQADIEMLRKAEARVKLRVKPVNFDAWRLSIRESMKAPEIAAQLQLNVTDVYVARSRINRMLKEEITRLEPCTRNPSPWPLKKAGKTCHQLTDAAFHEPVIIESASDECSMAESALSTPSCSGRSTRTASPEREQREELAAASPCPSGDGNNLST